MRKENKKTCDNGEIEKDIDLLGALQYSKAELQQADSKINTMLVVNSILIATLVTISLSFSKGEINWEWFWVLPFFIATNLTSVIILCFALFPVGSSENKNASPFYWRHMLKSVSDNMFEDSYYNERIKETLIINSKKSRKKYGTIKLAVFISYLPLTLIIWPILASVKCYKRCVELTERVKG